MSEKPLFRRVLRIELWLTLALICLLLVIFIRSSNSVNEQAEIVKADQLKTSFQSALRLLNTYWLAAGKPQQVVDFEKFGTGQLNLNQHGWPVAASGGSVSSQVTELGCQEVLSVLLKDAAIATAVPPIVRVLAVGSVCVYQFGDAHQDNFSLLYNADSGEVRMTRHQRKE